jgi:hypothetical protein
MLIDLPIEEMPVDTYLPLREDCQRGVLTND